MESSAAHRTLGIGEMLNWYRIERVLGRGGFGVIYLATDTNLDHPVAIKEYIPTDLAKRAGDTAVHPLTQGHGDMYQWGLQRFIKEARNLVRFKHPNIVRVMSVFQQNNTAYMVMEFEEGENLCRYLERADRRRESRLKSLIAPVSEGLAEVHRHGFIHRDVKPANILVRPDSSPVLLDFGSARDASARNGEALTALVTVGYAPLEQYDHGDDEQQGPWTDIYSLGGVLYYAISGNDPIDSARRGSALLNGGRDPLISAASIGRDRYSADFLAAIDWALSFRIADRPQTLSDWLPALLGSASVSSAQQGASDIDALMDLDGRSDAAPAPPVHTADHSPKARQRAGAGHTGAATRFNASVHSAPAQTRRPQRAANPIRRRRSLRRHLQPAVPWLLLAGSVVVAWWLVTDTLDSARETANPAVAVQSPENTPVPPQFDFDALAAERARQAELLADIERRERELAERQAAAEDARRAAARRIAEAEEARAARIAAENATTEAARRERLVAEARQRRAEANSRQFANALENAEQAISERRIDDARNALNAAANTGIDGSRLGIQQARLQRVIEEMKRPISDAEFDRVVRRFDGLKRAIESEDLAVIDALTQRSDQSELFRQLMRNFERVNMEITGIRVRNADKSVTANLRIADMVRDNGDRAVPSDAFRDREITSRLVDGEWSRIEW